MFRTATTNLLPQSVVAPGHERLLSSGATSLTAPQCDLARLRQVGQLEGRDLAKSFGAPFIECSAADGVNVEIAFRELVKLVRRDERVSGVWRGTVRHANSLRVRVWEVLRCAPGAPGVESWSSSSSLGDSVLGDGVLGDGVLGDSVLEPTR